MLDSIIKGYLSGGKRLVIPDFGTFIRKESGEVVFVEFLKKDDSVLTGIITGTHQVGASQARAMIESYVDKVKLQVLQQGSYTIEGIGTLRSDLSGLYELSYDPAATKQTVASSSGFVVEQGATAALSDNPAPKEAPTDAGLEVFPIGDQLIAARTDDGPTGGPTLQALEQSTVNDNIIEMGATRSETTVAEQVQPQVRESIIEVSSSGVGLVVESSSEVEKTAPVADPQDNVIEMTPRPKTPETYTAPATQRPSSAAAQTAPKTEPARTSTPQTPRPESVKPRPTIQSLYGDTPQRGQQQSTQQPPRAAQPQAGQPQRQPSNRPPTNWPPKKKKADIVLIVAIVAAIIAIGSIIVGVMADRNPIENMQPTNPVHIEQTLTPDQAPAPSDTTAIQ